MSTGLLADTPKQLERMTKPYYQAMHVKQLPMAVLQQGLRQRVGSLSVTTSSVMISWTKKGSHVVNYGIFFGQTAALVWEAFKHTFLFRAHPMQPPKRCLLSIQKHRSLQTATVRLVRWNNTTWQVRNKPAGYMHRLGKTLLSYRLQHQPLLPAAHR